MIAGYRLPVVINYNRITGSPSGIWHNTLILFFIDNHIEWELPI